METMKINQLEIENVKRIKAVKVEPAVDGLTIIGGNNNQGKTSVLDAIAWALGGDRYRPSQAVREGSMVPPNLHIVMSNGLVVERKGKNSDLKVTDPTGKKGGQQLLNEFVNQLALDLPKFMEASGKEKANTLLQIIGVGDQLAALERQETDQYNRRRAIGQIADQKKKFAKEQPYFPDAPKDIVSATELIKRQQDILAQNGENQRKRASSISWSRKASGSMRSWPPSCRDRRKYRMTLRLRGNLRKTCRMNPPPNWRPVSQTLKKPTGRYAPTWIRIRRRMMPGNTSASMMS